MVTVQKLSSVVKRLEQNYIPKAKRRRFRLGINQLTLSEFTSLNTAGRRSTANRSTGENRIRRLVDDVQLSDQLQQLLLTEALGSRYGYWYCSLDHSQFGPFCIAVLAVSNRAGRAIPLWVQVNVSEAALIAPLLTALEELFWFLGEAAPHLKLVLVMDRWFASDRLFTLFAEHNISFIARSKGNKLVRLPWDPSWWKEPLGDISNEELEIQYRSHQLRFVRSDYKHGMKGDEVWFLLTNLPTPSSKGAPDGLTRRQILNRYAERFEIEEAFKDVKWLQRLKWQQVRKPEVIRSLLLFIFLGWWLTWRYIAKQLPKQKTHPKKMLSWFRQAWEYLQWLLRTPLLPPLPVAQQTGEKK